MSAKLVLVNDKVGSLWFPDEVALDWIVDDGDGSSWDESVVADNEVESSFEWPCKVIEKGENRL